MVNRLVVCNVQFLLREGAAYDEMLLDALIAFDSTGRRKHKWRGGDQGCRPITPLGTCRKCLIMGLLQKTDQRSSDR